MNTPVFLLCASTVGLIALFFETFFLSEKPKFIQKSDKFLHETIKKIHRILRYVNKKTFVLLIHFLIEETENFFIRGFRKLKSFVRKHDK
jgi:hypothetical protein